MRVARQVQRRRVAPLRLCSDGRDTQEHPLQTLPTRVPKAVPRITRSTAVWPSTADSFSSTCPLPTPFNFPFLQFQNDAAYSCCATVYSIRPLTLMSRDEVGACISPADRAKLNLQVAYGVTSLFYMLLRTQGVSPLKHPVKAELDRIR